MQASEFTQTAPDEELIAQLPPVSPEVAPNPETLDYTLTLKNSGIRNPTPEAWDPRHVPETQAPKRQEEEAVAPSPEPGGSPPAETDTANAKPIT